VRLPDGLEWCRARTSWTAHPGGAATIECAPSTHDYDKVATALARLALDLTGRSVTERYSRETIGGRYTVHKYWAGPAAQPSIEARIVEADGRIIWAGIVAPGVTLEEQAIGPAPDWEPSIPPPPRQLEPPEAPRGQKIVRRPPIYAAEGIPEIPRDPRLEIGFYSPRGAEAQASVDPQALPVGEEELDFHCVTGWSVRGVRWRLVPLRRVFEEAGVPLEGSRWILALSWGGYATIFPASLAGRVWLVTGEDGAPLGLERGWPARLTSGVLFGWKHAKWLRGLYVGDSYLDGFWEARGYHWRGLVVLDERFKILI